MSLDSIRNTRGLSVVHQHFPRAQSPQRRCAAFVGGMSPAILNDWIVSSHVVKQEIAERMDDFITERRRHFKSSTVDRSSHRRCQEDRNMAGGTTCLDEDG